MKNAFYTLIALLMFACGTGTKEMEDQTTETEATTETIDSEWTTLFDGETMNGWRTYQNKENDSWKIEDGTLHCLPFDSAKMRADLITEEQYANFELVLEWKISNQSNSGIIYRASEALKDPYLTGPEYQVLDDQNYPGETLPNRMTGANYDMHAPSAKNLNPVGEWNETKIVVNGNHVEHWLNGDKVVEYELHSEDWTKRKSESKWKDVEGYGMEVKGHIDLQDHGNEVWFRNIRIKEL
jgi:hypothetical protein